MLQKSETAGNVRIFLIVAVYFYVLAQTTRNVVKINKELPEKIILNRNYS